MVTTEHQINHLKSALNFLTRFSVNQIGKKMLWHHTTFWLVKVVPCLRIGAYGEIWDGIWSFSARQ